MSDLEHYYPDCSKIAERTDSFNEEARLRQELWELDMRLNRIENIMKEKSDLAKGDQI